MRKNKYKNLMPEMEAMFNEVQELLEWWEDYKKTHPVKRTSSKDAGTKDTNILSKEKADVKTV